MTGCELAESCFQLEKFIEGNDRSLAAAGRLEVALDQAFPDDDEIQAYVTMFASYRPEGGDFLYNEDQMVVPDGGQEPGASGTATRSRIEY